MEKEPLKDKNFFAYNAVIEASAGTGKTYQLEHLFIRLLIEKFIPIERILMISYTKKASYEIKERILLKMKSVLEERKFLSSQLSSEQEEFLLKQYLYSKKLQVFTIHAFCQSLLGEMSFDLGEICRFELVSNYSRYRESLMFLVQKLEQTRDKSFYIYVSYKGFNEKNFLKFLHYPELWALDYEQKKISLFVHAKIVESDLKKFTASSLINFANKFKHLKTLSKELVRLYKIKENNLFPYELVGSGANAVPQIFLKVGNLKLEKHFDGLVEQDFKIIAEFIKDYQFKKGKNWQNYENFAYLVEAYEISMAFKIWEEVFEDNQSNLYTDFSGILIKTHKVLQNEACKEEIQKKYDYAFIDEFQDTNDVQWEIIKKLFLDINSSGGRLCLIGDPKQAIYSFQGANLETFFEAVDSLISSGGMKYNLTTNYRSSPSLVDCYNKLFSSKLLWGDEFPLAIPTEKTSASYSLFLYGCNEGKENLKNPYLFYSDCIAQELLKSKISFQDVSILYSRQSEGLEELKRVLTAYGIPFITQKENLFSTIEAQIVLLLLDYLIDMNDKKLKSLLVSPLFSFTLEELQDDNLLEDTNLMNMFSYWSDLVHKGLWVKFFESVLYESDLIAGLDNLDRKITFSRFEQIFFYLRELVWEEKLSIFNLHYRFEALIIKSLNKSENVQFSVEEDVDAVKIMTIHSSKGLEFPYVFIFPCSPRREEIKKEEKIEKAKKERLPMDHPAYIFKGLSIYRNSSHIYVTVSPAYKTIKISEEKKHLFYVACTRAKERLYLPYETNIKVWEFANCCKEFFEESIEYKSVKHLSYAMKDLVEGDLISAKTEKRDAELKLAGDVKELGIKISKKYSSFSSSFEHKKGDLEDYSLTRKEVEGDGSLKGLEFGSCVHFLLEKIDFSIVNSFAKEKEFINSSFWEQFFNSNNFLFIAEKAYKETKNFIGSMLWRSLKKTLPSLGISICELKSDLIEKEVEFMFEKGEGLFMQGFMDLVFEYKNKFYIVDWKTNLLESYKTDAIGMAMKDYFYDKQLEIYLNALEKYLNSDSSKIGGGFYFFMRGISLENQNGLYFKKY